MLTETLTHEPRTSREIAMEWDAIASYRAQQIATGTDLSYHYVLKPTVLDLLGRATRGPVVDVGCGVGFLTHELACFASPIYGVDLSEESIRIAKSRCTSNRHVRFECTSIEDFAARRPGKFNAAVANMVLMTVPKLAETLNAISTLLRPGGLLVITIPHPCFWPRYWQYEHEDWFRYSNEIFIQAPFRISRDTRSLFWTTHIHRPLTEYVECLRASGFRITRLCEPVPSEQEQERYPVPWDYPRFLAMRCAKDLGVAPCEIAQSRPIGAA